MIKLLLTSMTSFAAIHASDPYTKITDNSGKGDAQVSGIRNVREVIPGILYRSGSVGGTKPLNSQALQKLCALGFSDVYYDYNTGMTSDHVVSCGSHKMDYMSRPSLANDKNPYLQLKSIYNVIIKQQQGPVLTHCWNGWHASGLVSAYALMQFCGWTNKEALAYWIKNTDGNSNYPKVKAKVMSFRPYEELKTTGVRCFKP